MSTQMATDIISQLWYKYIIKDTSDFVAFSIYSYLQIIIVFWGFNLPFILLHFFPLKCLEKYRVTKKRDNTDFLKVFFGVVGIHAMVFLIGLNMHNTAKAFGMRRDLPLPSWYTIVWQLLACMIMEDTLFYWGHRMFHLEWFYKKFHYIHHQVQYTYSIASNYFHPVEYFVGVVIPVLLPPLLLKCHLFTYWIWNTIMILETTLAHCGYNFPYVFVDGREHAYHHSHFQDNYGAWFNLWDKLLGTDKNWRKYEAKKEKEKQK